MNQQTFESLKFVDGQLELIDDIAVDYDGCRTAESLCELIDELVHTIAVARRRLNSVLEPVRHGKWKKYSTTMMECSLCGKHVARHRFDYCPNCGAKMDGGIQKQC